MIAGLLAGLLLPAASGTALIRLALPELWVRSRVLVGSLGVIVALGLSSVLFATSVFAFGPHWPPYVVVEAGVWAVVLGGSLAAARGRAPGARRSRRFTLAEVVAALAFAAALSVSLIHFYWLSSSFPSGEWDAQAIWNLRARFLHRGLEGHWRDAFLPVLAWSLPDYPLMLPASTARLWTYARGESPLVPIVLAASFNYATVGLLVGGLMAIRGRWEAYCGGAVLLASLGFNTWGAGQIADVPLGAFALGATVLLSWLLERRAEPLSAGACGLLTFCAGCVAWTKNEGLVFAAAICATLGLVLVYRREWRPGTLASAAVGLMVPAAALLYFKRTLAPPNYLFQASNIAGLSEKLWDMERHAAILRSFARELWSWNTQAAVGMIPLVAAYAVGASVMRGVRRIQGLIFVPFAAMLLGYYASYVLTPFDLRWHLESSLGRLLVQVWPVLVFACFSIAEPFRPADDDRPAE